MHLNGMGGEIRTLSDAQRAHQSGNSQRCEVHYDGIFCFFLL